MSNGNGNSHGIGNGNGKPNAKKSVGDPIMSASAFSEWMNALPRQDRPIKDEIMALLRTETRKCFEAQDREGLPRIYDIMDRIHIARTCACAYLQELRKEGLAVCIRVGRDHRWCADLSKVAA